MIAPLKTVAAWRAALAGSAGRTLDIIVHLGAHRTATATFQQFTLRNAGALRAAGVEVWTPDRTRNGLFSGLIERPLAMTAQTERPGERSAGLITMELSRLRQTGCRQLIVSEANLIGTVRGNLAAERLYPDLESRLTRFRQSLGAARLRVALAIRSHDTFWASSFAHALRKGFRLPDVAALDRLVTQPRRWRDVISDIARSLPGSDVIVLPFERIAGRPEAQLQQMTGGLVLAAPTGMRDWLNPGPRCDKLRTILELQGQSAAAAQIPAGGGRWMPFDAAQQAALRAQYRADLDWLAAGADGIARLAGSHDELTAEITRSGQETGAMPPVPLPAEGQVYGKQHFMV